MVGSFPDACLAFFCFSAEIKSCWLLTMIYWFRCSMKDLHRFELTFIRRRESTSFGLEW